MKFFAFTRRLSIFLLLVALAPALATARTLRLFLL